VRLLEGLKDRSESRFFAKNADWEYPASKLELMVANLIDLITIVNTDPKHQYKFKPFPRPFKVTMSGEKTIGGTVMSFDEAREAFWNKPLQTKTDEEIIELNKQFIQKQKEQNV
jgi:hypothetical protein